MDSPDLADKPDSTNPHSKRRLGGNRGGIRDGGKGKYDSVVEVIRYYFKGVVSLVDEKQVLLCSQAVAFKVLITSAPILILLLGFIGRLLSTDNAYDAVTNFVTGYLPSYDAERLIGFAEQLERISLTLTVVGTVTLIVTATTLFSTLRTVLAIVFQEDWHTHRSKVRGLLFDARMAGQVGVLFVLTVALTTTVHSLDALGLSILEQIGTRPDWLRSGWIEFVRYLSWFAPVALSLGMFYQLYYFVPVPRPPKKSVLVGALIAATMWELGKFAFTRFATRVGRINVWLPEIDNERIHAIGDAFAIVISFVFWAYISGLILMIGAVIALLHERRHRERAGLI